MTPSSDPSSPRLDAPRAALEAARAARLAVKGSSPHDPARREALTGALGSLVASWTPAHKAYMRSGPVVGRAFSDDPVRVLRREMVAEAKSLRAALSPASGTSRTPKYEPIDAQQMQGRLGRFKQMLVKIADEHDACRRLYRTGSWTTVKGGGTFRSMRELNEAATALLDDLRAERRAVKLAWERYERHQPRFDPKRPHAHIDMRDELADLLAALRDEANVLAADLAASVGRREPLPGPARAEPWTAEKIRRVLDYHRARDGRLPTKRDLNGDNSLPQYTTVRRMLGPRPLTRLADSLRTQHS